MCWCRSYCDHTLLYRQAVVYFCGSDAGGQRAACIYTLVETAKMTGINPQAYLADILGRIAEYPIHQIDALLAWLWTQ